MSAEFQQRVVIDVAAATSPLDVKIDGTSHFTISSGGAVTIRATTGQSMSLTQSGIPRIFFDGNGEILINTAASQTLTIAQSGAARFLADAAGAVTIDTAASQVFSLKQNAANRLVVSAAGQIDITAANNQDINIAATGTGAVNITGNIDLGIQITTETLTVSNDTSAVFMTEFVDDFGSVLLMAEGDGNGIAASDTHATFLLAKKVGADGVVARLVSVAGGSAEELIVTWPDGNAPTVAMSIDVSTAGGYNAATSDIRLSIISGKNT